jgi:anaphase-promoting complex subunit 11
MSSRKRSSETPLISAGKEDMEIVVEDTKDGCSSCLTMAVRKPRPRLRVRIRRYHAVAKWTWNVGRGGEEEEEELCGICQSAFEGTPPGVKYPGDEAPVVFGVCGHAFHLQCVATWLNSSRQTCPICRADWEYGNSEQSSNRASNSSSQAGNQQATTTG